MIYVKKELFIICILLSSYTLLSSQELGGVNYVYFPSIQAENNNLEVDLFTSEFNIPIFTSESLFLIISPKYNFINIQISENIENSITFHTLMTPVKVIYKTEIPLSIIGAFIPSISSEYKNGLYDPYFKLNGSIIGIYPIKDTRIILGLALTDDLGVPKVLPVIGSNMSLGNWKFSGIFPEGASLHYKWHSGASLGLNIETIGGEFHIGSEKYDTIYLSYNQVLMGVNFLYPLQKPLHLSFSSGVAISPLPVEVELNKNLVINGSLDPSLFLSMGIVLKMDN